MLRHSGSGTRLEGAGPGVMHWGLSLSSGPSWTSASSCREPLEHDVCPETTKPGNMNCNQAKRYSQVFCGSNRMVIIIACVFFLFTFQIRSIKYLLTPPVFHHVVCKGRLLLLPFCPSALCSVRHSRYTIQRKQRARCISRPWGQVMLLLSTQMRHRL